MLNRYLKPEDIEIYLTDIKQCYKDNPQVFDMQNPINSENERELKDFLLSFINSEESMIEGIFDSQEDYLFGFIIYDGIRLTDDGNAAQVHICMCKDMWGKDFLPVYQRIINECLFDTIYAMMPACCRGAITLCKKLGFKKTGYVPKAIPYKTLKGEIKMFDELIYTLQKPEIITLDKEDVCLTA